MRFLLIYILLESAFSLPTFSALGILGTFFEIILSAFLGFFILLNANSTISESFMALRQQSINPFTFQAFSILTILGAFLLILPGIFTDILGILMQFGSITTILQNRLNKKQNSNFHDKMNENFKGDDDVIDVEIIEHHNFK